MLFFSLCKYCATVSGSPELPDGCGHDRITQNRPYKNKSSRGKIAGRESGPEWLKPSLYYHTGIAADFLVGWT